MGEKGPKQQIDRPTPYRCVEECKRYSGVEGGKGDLTERGLVPYLNSALSRELPIYVVEGCTLPSLKVAPSYLLKPASCFTPVWGPQ